MTEKKVLTNALTHFIVFKSDLLDEHTLATNCLKYIQENEITNDWLQSNVRILAQVISFRWKYLDEEIKYCTDEIERNELRQERSVLRNIRNSFDKRILSLL